MYKKILIATDGSDLAGHAVEHGLKLAGSVGAEVIFVTVTEQWSAMDMASEIRGGKTDPVAVYEEAAAQGAEAILKAAADKAAAAGVTADTRHVKDHHPAEGIMEIAELEDCDLIVMASHGRRGLQKVLLGSETAEVISFGKRSVLVVH